MFEYILNVIHEAFRGVHAWTASAMGGDDVAASIVMTAMVTGVVFTLRTGWKIAKRFFLSRLVVEIVANNASWEDRFVFNELSSFVLKVIGRDKARRLLLSGTYLGRGKSKALFMIGSGLHFFFYKGRLMWVTRWTESSESSTVKEFIKLSSIGTTATNLERLVNVALPVDSEDKTNYINVYKTNDKKWVSVGSVVKRPLGKVSLPQHIHDNVRHHLDQFIDGKTWLRDNGFRCKQTILFYGPPGTGKSSLALAIASELGVDIYSLSLSMVGADELVGLTSHIENGSVLLLEDIHGEECLLKPEYQNIKGSKNMLSEVLNFLDGVSGVEDLVIIMTTNYLERLTPELYRASRVDLLQEIGYLGFEEVMNLVRIYYPGIDNVQIPHVPNLSISGGAIEPMIKAAMGDEEKFIKSFIAFLWEHKEKTEQKTLKTA